VTLSAERNVSSLRRIKEHGYRKIDWTLLRARRDIMMNPEDAIDVFAKSDRRLDFYRFRFTGYVCFSYSISVLSLPFGTCKPNRCILHDDITVSKTHARTER